MRKFFLPSLFVLLVALVLAFVRYPAFAQTVNNYLYLNGNVGVGTNNPTSLFSVGSGSTTNFSVDSAGNTTIKGSLTVNGTINGTGSSKPYFIAGDNRGWVSGSGGWNRVVYNTVTAGNSGNWYNPSTGVFTAPVAGLYFCSNENYNQSQQGVGYIHDTFGCNGDWDGGSNACGMGYHDYTIYEEDRANWDTSTSNQRFAYLQPGNTLQVDVYLSSAGNYMYGQHSQFACALISN